jgi:transcriptional regulator with XRE-family HTH domain
MTNEELVKWRKTVALTQQEAADRLGVSLATYENYERGSRRDNDQPVKIPDYIELACDGLSLRLAADNVDVHRLTPKARELARQVMYFLSLPAWIAGGKRKEGQMYPTQHALLRDEGMIPKNEPSLLEQLFPLADANKLREMMVQQGLRDSAPVHGLEKKSAT